MGGGDGGGDGGGAQDGSSYLLALFLSCLMALGKIQVSLALVSTNARQHQAQLLWMGASPGKAIFKTIPGSV